MWKKIRICQFEDCDGIVYARNYCRRHYNQLWRQGKVGRANSLTAEEQRMPTRNVEILRSLEREFKRAKVMYSAVCGLEGRVKWYREIQNIKQEISKIKSTAKPAPVTAND